MSFYLNSIYVFISILSPSLTEDEDTLYDPDQPSTPENRRPSGVEVLKDASKSPTGNLAPSLKRITRIIEKIYPMALKMDNNRVMTLEDGSKITYDDVIELRSDILILNQQITDLKRAETEKSIENERLALDLAASNVALTERLNEVQTLTAEKEHLSSILNNENIKYGLLHSQFLSKCSELSSIVCNSAHIKQENEVLRISNQSLTNEVGELRHFRDHVSNDMINKVEERFKSRLEEALKECDVLRLSNSNLRSKADKSDRERDRLQALYDSTLSRRGNIFELTSTSQDLSTQSNNESIINNPVIENEFL